MSEVNKVLYRGEDFVIGTYDQLNFFVGREVTIKTGKKAGTIVYKDMKYFAKMDDAILGYARAIAGTLSDDLASYVSLYRTTTEKLRETAFLALHREPNSTIPCQTT